MLLALGPVANWSIVDWVVTIIILAAVVGIAIATCQDFGITVPPVVWRIFGIVIVAAFAILAIRFLLSL